ncbi:hypothetical protein AB0M92_36575 [Streptomyces sp. NPDC051582]|uniref:hypothetical protein n=1 Tax=Streptomyces sp. NPDC051582 TaxID=3155167 RepID=UPI00343A6FF9
MSAHLYGELVDELGTRFTRTSVYRRKAGQSDADDGAYLWVRSAGPARSVQMQVPNRPVECLLRGLPVTALRLSLPRQDGHALVYPAPGPWSLGKLLMQQHPSQSYPRARELLRELGALLRHLHAAPPADVALLAADRRPDRSGVHRLAHWLAGGDTTASEPLRRLAALTRDQLGQGRWGKLRDWCDAALDDRAGRVLLHGNPGTGVLVPGLGDLPCVLLIGEDVQVGPAALDTGRVLGELTELRGIITRKGGQEAAAQWSRLGRAFLDGYTDDLSPLAGMVATLTVLAHVRDYCEFAGWDDWWFSVALELVAELLDGNGKDAIDWH